MSVTFCNAQQVDLEVLRGLFEELGLFLGLDDVSADRAQAVST